MIDASFLKINTQDTSKLHGLSLRTAFAIHVMKWNWYKRPQDGYPYILLDKKPKKNKLLNEDIAYYIGDGRYIYKNIPEYDLNYKLIDIICKNVVALKMGEYLEIEMAKVLNSHRHLDFIMCTPEQKCRAVLNVYIKQNQRIIANKHNETQIA